MDVEFLFWDGCPSYERALADLRAEMAGLGLEEAEVMVREIRTQDEAEQAEFVGSPTIRVDGNDVDPPNHEPAGLTCRIYMRDGRVSPLPDPETVREALRAGAANAGAR